MGGRSIFVVKKGDKNANVIFETLTDYGTRFAMCQVFVPEIRAGDKRILLIQGEPVPYALARIPTGDDNQKMSGRDFEICEQVGPYLRDAGVLFAGIDVIGDFLTEVNVTSPTGIRELDKQFGLNIAGLLFDAIYASQKLK
jgi:glutathione synthase